jgi:very-short-patch-repair endonuclease
LPQGEGLRRNLNVTETEAQVQPDLFVRLCRERGLPEPVTEHRFAPPRRWRFDFSWPDAKIALEVEGGIWSGGRHTRGAGFVGDMAKYNHAARLGWRVLRVQPKELLTLATVQLVREAKSA